MFQFGFFCGQPPSIFVHPVSQRLSVADLEDVKWFAESVVRALKPTLGEVFQRENPRNQRCFQDMKVNLS